MTQQLDLVDARTSQILSPEARFQTLRRLELGDGAWFDHAPGWLAALYRSGNDSVAWHGDCLARRMAQALVATLSLGAERKFLLRKTGGGESTRLFLRSGDLVVTDGTCQRTHQHSIPKTSARAEPRIALMYRPIWRESDQSY